MTTLEKPNYALGDYNDAKAYLGRELEKLNQLYKMDFLLKDSEASWCHAAALKNAAERVAAARRHIEKEWQRFNK